MYNLSDSSPVFVIAAVTVKVSTSVTSEGPIQVVQRRLYRASGTIPKRFMDREAEAVALAAKPRRRKDATEAIILGYLQRKKEQTATLEDQDCRLLF